MLVSSDRLGLLVPSFVLVSRNNVIILYVSVVASEGVSTSLLSASCMGMYCFYILLAFKTRISHRRVRNFLIAQELGNRRLLGQVERSARFVDEHYVWSHCSM